MTVTFSTFVNCAKLSLALGFAIAAYDAIFSPQIALVRPLDVWLIFQVPISVVAVGAVGLLLVGAP